MTYIPTNTNYSRPRGHNYTHTNVIDGFYINTQNFDIYTCTTLIEANVQSDHLSIILNIPRNILLARRPSPPTTCPTRIMNPIPPETVEQVTTIFFDENAIVQNTITTLLSVDQLPDKHWLLACSELQHIIQKISRTTENTCSTTPLLVLTNRAAQQRRFLPQTVQKIWKTHFKTYHLLRKPIYITHNTINSRNHGILYEIISHTDINIPPPPNDDFLTNGWIKEIPTVAKTTNIQVRNFSTTYTIECQKK